MLINKDEYWFNLYARYGLYVINPNADSFFRPHEPLERGQIPKINLIFVYRFQVPCSGTVSARAGASWTGGCIGWISLA